MWEISNGKTKLLVWKEKERNCKKEKKEEKRLNKIAKGAGGDQAPSIDDGETPTDSDS